MKLVKIGNSVINLENLCAAEFQNSPDSEIKIFLNYATPEIVTIFRGSQAIALWEYLLVGTFDVTPDDPTTDEEESDDTPTA